MEFPAQTSGSIADMTLKSKYALGEVPPTAESCRCDCALLCKLHLCKFFSIQ
jgi:hypothetical protein